MSAADQRPRMANSVTLEFCQGLLPPGHSIDGSCHLLLSGVDTHTCVIWIPYRVKAVLPGNSLDHLVLDTIPRLPPLKALGALERPLVLSTHGSGCFGRPAATPTLMSSSLGHHLGRWSSQEVKGHPSPSPPLMGDVGCWPRHSLFPRPRTPP